MAMETASDTTPEGAAYMLMKLIAAEEMATTTRQIPEPARDYYLDLYCECIHVVRKSFRKRKGHDEGLSALEK